METITATPIRRLANFSGDALLYSLSAPLPWHDHRDEGQTRYVAVSAIPADAVYPRHDETMVFPAEPDGTIRSWRELTSVWECSHAAAFERLGVVIKPQG
jgi:hypothetical protein